MESTWKVVSIIIIFLALASIFYAINLLVRTMRMIADPMIEQSHYMERA